MKLIYILLVLCLCFCCKSKRELSYHSEYRQEYQEQKNIHEQETHSRDSSGQKITEIVNRKESDNETETVTKTTEYDTSKPTDPETGKPPVIRETESITRTNKKDRENTSGKIAKNSNVSDQSDKVTTDLSGSTQSSDNTEDFDQAKTTDFFKMPWLWIVLGGGLVLLVGYFVKNKINPVKWILRFVK